MIFYPMSETLNRKFFALQPPRVDYVKCAYDTGDGWYFYWAPLDSNGCPIDTGEEFHISEFPVIGDYVTSHELGLMGVVVV
jgi:hypothetical protein